MLHSMPNRLYTLREVAEMIGTSRQSVQARLLRLRASGHNIGQMIGVQWLLTARDVEALKPGPGGRPKRVQG